MSNGLCYFFFQRINIIYWYLMEKLFNVFSIAYVTHCMHTGMLQSRHLFEFPLEYWASLLSLLQICILQGHVYTQHTVLGIHMWLCGYRIYDAWGIKYKRGEETEHRVSVGRGSKLSVHRDLTLYVCASAAQ